jgi:hypothetical protein
MLPRFVPVRVTAPRSYLHDSTRQAVPDSQSCHMRRMTGVMVIRVISSSMTAATVSPRAVPGILFLPSRNGTIMNLEFLFSALTSVWG